MQLPLLRASTPAVTACRAKFCSPPEAQSCTIHTAADGDSENRELSSSGEFGQAVAGGSSNGQDSHDDQMPNTDSQCAPMRICLDQAIPAGVPKERKLRFGIDQCMLEELVGSFDLGRLCKQVPRDCNLHPKARDLLRQACCCPRHDDTGCLVVFVDGSFDPLKAACAWAVAVFDYNAPEDIAWHGYMAGCLRDEQHGSQASAFTAELFGQLVANLICASQAHRNIVVAYDATSAAG